jgi:hypothetical protein
MDSICRVGQGPPCIHDKSGGSDENEMIDCPIPLAERNSLLFRDVVGLLRNVEGDLRLRPICSDGVSKPERIELVVDSCSHGSKFLVIPATNQADCLDEVKRRATNEPVEPLGSPDRHKRPKLNPEYKGACSVCKLHTCCPLDTVAQLRFDNVILDLQNNLGVSMTQAKAERHSM